MPDSQSSPAPDRAMLILANAVAEIIGPTSVAFQQLVVAAGTRARGDHVRARETFDRLPSAQRQAVKGKAEVTAASIRKQTVLRDVLRNLPRWRPDNVEWVWPAGTRPTPSANR